MTKLMSDPYAVLGIPRDADEQQVRDAYRRLAKRYHPDLHPDAQTSDRMRRVNEAWDVLSDPARRARYDADHGRVGSPMPASWSGSSRRPGAAAGSARPWPPAWAPSATANGSGAQPVGWGASSWTSRPGWRAASEGRCRLSERPAVGRPARHPRRRVARDRRVLRRVPAAAGARVPRGCRGELGPQPMGLTGASAHSSSRSALTSSGRSTHAPSSLGTGGTGTAHGSIRAST